MSATPAPVVALLSEDDPEARRLGAQRISELSGDEAVGLLLRALGDRDWRVRKEAVAVSSTVQPRAAVLHLLARALDDHDNVGLRNASVEALVLIGTDAVPVAVRALGDLDADGRKLAVEVLGGVPDAAGTAALARALDDEDVNVRVAAAEALGSANLAGDDARGEAIVALTGALADGQLVLLRLAALRSLTTLEAELPWSVLAPLATDPLLRRLATAAAVNTHDPDAVAALTRAIGEPSLSGARDALVAVVDCLSTSENPGELGRIARHELRRSALAEQRVRTFASGAEGSRVRGAALVALGLLRAPADVPHLVRGLSDEEVAEHAELALRWFGQEAVPTLLEEGRRSAPSVRAAALSLIPRLTEQTDPETLHALRAALDSEAPEVQAAALQAIGTTGEAEDLAKAATYVTSPDPRVAAAAASALGALASRYPAESHALAASIAPSSPAASVACILLGASARGDAGAGAQKQTAIAFLRGALDHDDARVRRAAVDALLEIGGPVAAEVVARALADEETSVVLLAVRALGRMGQTERLLGLLEGVHDRSVVAGALRALGDASPDRAFDAARALLSSDDALLASSAVETIGHLRGPRRDEALFVALDHPDAGVVKGALVELSRDISPVILGRIALCLESPSYDVRRFAAELLAGTSDSTTHALLRSRLDRETDPDVREALMLALAPRSPRDEP
jgi:HEAT repeat protein